ncbi:MAG: GntR family transcriptional regulator [Victivallaceae bacterium]|nr:GntR family transcriptional regulator [Victivallaceae bacterium]
MINLKTQKEIVYLRLKEDILNRKWQPGDKLVERKIGKELGVSRMPVREAFNRLHKDGLVEHVPQWGVYVKKLSKKEILEMYEVREMLDGLAARLLAARAEKKEIDILKNIIKKMEKALALENFSDLNKFDNEFHHFIICASRNEKLIDIASMCQVSVHRLHNAENSVSPTQEKNLDEHRQICKCIELKDEEEAEKVARQHLKNAKQNAEKCFGKYNP